MQLTCLNATLSHSLRLVGHAVPSQTPAIPVLNHVLLDATPGTLTLAASNLAWHLVHRMPADVITPGRVTVPATVFTEWVKTLPPGATSELTLDPTTLTLSLTSTPVTARFRGLDADGFPLLPEPDADTVEVAADALRTALARVAFAASEDANRYVLTAVLAQFEGQTLTLAATDGFRLSEAQVPLAMPVTTPFTVLVPAPVLAALQRMLVPEGQVTLTVTDLRDRIAVRFGATTLVSQAVEGSYPNYRGVLPTSTASSATVARPALLHACQRARIFARDVGGLVRLHLAAEGLTVAADSASGEQSRTTLPVLDHHGTALDIAFRVDFLIAALAALDTPQVGLRFNGALQPGVIDLAPAQPFVHAVMPLQLAAAEERR